MAVRTWVGRFAIVDGQPQEESALMRSFPRQRPDEEEDELYVLAEPATPASREYCGQLVDAIGRLYKQDALSLTGAVSRAMKSAHQQLRDWNQRTLREHHVLAGVSCLAVRGRHAYLAQIGPSVAYHVGDGRVRKVVPQDGAVQPLGQADTAEPIFSHYQLSPGDLLVIASPQIDGLLGEDTLRSVLLRGGDEALVELFRLAREQRDFSLVLLACVVEPEDEPVAETPPAQPVPSRAEPPAPPPVAVARAPAAAATLPVAAGQPPVRLKGAEAGVRYRRSTGLGASFPRVPAAAIVALLVLIAVGLLAWVIIPPALKQSRTERFDSLVEDARVAYDSSQATQDPALKRAALRTADQKLIDAEALTPGTPEVADLRTKVDGELAKQNAIVELPELQRIVDVSDQVPGPISPKDLAIGGGGAYVLDRQQGRVMAISLLGPNPEPFVMFQTNQQIGQELAGAPQQIAWAEQLGALLVLDDARRLVAVTPTQDARILTVRDAQSWGSADGIAYTNSNLYVLDRAGDQVWRYPPSQDGFDSEREPLLANLDFAQVVELAVGDALYLVLGDNSILRFRDGAAQPFTQAGIDRALASPGAIVPLASTGTVLVADRGNSRLVVFSQDGTFRQQLVSASFTDLRSIAVDEPNRLVYIMVAGILYRTPLPAAPQ